jgi:AcrR family transcriptional regulator
MSGEERKERERLQREREILDAAQSLFTEKGFDAMTMDEVAKRADFTKRTVYSYFAGKEDLAAAVVARSLARLNDLFAEAVKNGTTGLECIHAIGMEFIRFAENAPADFGVLARSEGNFGDPATAPHLESVIREVQRELEIMGGAIAEGIADGTIRKDLDPTLTSIYLANFSTSMMSAVRGPGSAMLAQFGIPAERFIEKGMEFFLFALRNEKGGS